MVRQLAEAEAARGKHTIVDPKGIKELEKQMVNTAHACWGFAGAGSCTAPEQSSKPARSALQAQIAEKAKQAVSEGADEKKSESSCHPCKAPYK